MSQRRILNVTAAVGIVLTTVLLGLMIGNDKGHLNCVLAAISVLTLFALSTAHRRKGYKRLAIGFFLLAIYMARHTWVKLLENRAGATNYLTVEGSMQAQSFWQSTDMTLIFNILLAAGVFCLYFGLSHLIKFGRRDKLVH